MLTERMKRTINKNIFADSIKHEDPRQIGQSLGDCSQKNPCYVRVPAGKLFYLHITQNVAMKKRIESLQQEAGKVPALQQQVDKLKQQLESEPLETPAPKNQPVEEKPAGFTLEDQQRNLIAEMKLNDELSCELDAQEGRRHLVLMDNFFLNTITP